MTPTEQLLRDALEPCPLCGQNPQGPKKEGGSDERMGYNFTVTIKCACGVSISRKSHDNKNGWCDDTGQAQAEVIAAWNRRAATSPAPQEAVPSDIDTT